jgi:ribosomal protein S18 acetylase RimI-like enzyme
MTTTRPATPADTTALGRLGAQLVAFHHDLDPERFIPSRSGTERGYGSYLKDELRRQGVVMLVAEEAGEVVGYAYAGLEGHDWMTLRGPAGVIYDLVVDPRRRGNGIGRKLLDDVVAALSASGAPRVVLSTAARNEGAQRLFASAGFRPTMIEMSRGSAA